MVGINDSAFDSQFVIDQGVVGQVGNGFIGKAVTALFDRFCRVLVHDKYDPTTVPLADVVREAQLIFVAVPTPMVDGTGECHTGIVESVLYDIQDTALEIGRDLEEFIVVIKSTVPPGFTDRMKRKHALRIAFSPEFLTEANSINDFKFAKRLLIGGDIEDAIVIFKYFSHVWHDRMFDDNGQYHGTHPAGPVLIVQCPPKTAEMVKLTTNAFLSTKVLFFNEIYRVCEKLGISFDEMKDLTLLDGRIGKSHTNVPGPDGHMGFGGHCFNKDLANLIHVCKELGTEQKLFSVVEQRNLEIRDDRDWEQMQGRAVIKK